MKNTSLFGVLLTVILMGCHPSEPSSVLTDPEKKSIRNSIQKEIDVLIQAVSNKDIATYMEKMPEDFIIYDEEGEIITRHQQREYALRDWSIIKETLTNEMKIDSIDFVSSDSLFVFTSQRWERLMYQRDGVTIDTVITTQLHKELWKNKPTRGWVGYDVEELGGEVYINGERYFPD